MEKIYSKKWDQASKNIIGLSTIEVYEGILNGKLKQSREEGCEMER